MKYCKLCSKHFIEDCFQRDLRLELLEIKKQVKLKNDAVPTLFGFSFYNMFSGGYWVRRMRQLPRAPLKVVIVYPVIIPTYSFSELQMFFRDHYEVGTKSGKYKIDSR